MDKNKGTANKGNLVVGVYYRPPDQGEDVDEAFASLLRLQEASHLQALILLGHINHPDTGNLSSTSLRTLNLKAGGTGGMESLPS